MISSIVRGSIIAVALCALAGTAAAEGHGASAETQVAQVPFWAWPYFKKYKNQQHFRALACARAGRGQGEYCYGYYEAPTARAAADGAVEMCDKGARRLGIFAPCRLLLVGDRDVSRMRRAGLDRAIEEYQAAAGPPGLWPGFTPGPVAGVTGVTMLKFTFTSGVRDYQPTDNLRAVRFADGGFHIHVLWALDLAVVKRFFVRFEVFDAAGRLVVNRAVVHAPTARRWSTWHWVDIFKVNKPGKWKVSVYVSTGPGEAKVGETYLTVESE